MLGLFRKHRRANTPEGPLADVTIKSQSQGSGLYVDTENLQNNAQLVIETTIGQWPEGIPPLARLNLYVRADQVSLWDVWAASRFPGPTVIVKGIQHFTSSHSKNSADIAIAIDAVADFVTGAIQFVSVISDDSDFMPLYAKLKELGRFRAPFLWVMTDRIRTKASSIEEFFPNDHIHMVHVPATSARSRGASEKAGADSIQLLEIADFIIQQIPVGPFKSVECQPIIGSRWSTHPMVSMTGQQFGVEFANNLWPILERKGVRLLRTGPRKYEMTSGAKNAASQDRLADRQGERPSLQ